MKIKSLPFASIGYSIILGLLPVQDTAAADGVATPTAG